MAIYTKKASPKRKLVYKKRELITKEVLLIKRAKRCAHLKQAMTMPAWSMPSKSMQNMGHLWLVEIWWTEIHQAYNHSLLF